MKGQVKALNSPTRILGVEVEESDGKTGQRVKDRVGGEEGEEEGENEGYFSGQGRQAEGVLGWRKGCGDGEG